jgi:hypothetical protein
MARKDRKKISFRFVYMIFFGLLLTAATLLTEERMVKLPFGAGMTTDMLYTLRTVVYVALMHVSRRALVDYIDLEEVFKKAMETSEGAGKIFMGIGLMMVAVAICIFAAVKL